MTVNERLYAAGSLDAYAAAIAAGRLEEVTRILAQVGLRLDAAGMHWPLDTGIDDAQNR